MPYPNHTLLVFGGSYSEPLISGEIWATSVRLTGGWAADPDWQGIVEEAALKVEAFFTTATFNALCTLEYVKMNPIGPDGNYTIEDQTYGVFYDTPPTGGRGGGVLPLQNAIVVTTLTARRRGLASKGRMFLPATSNSQLGVGGFILPAIQQQIADATAGFLFSLRLWDLEWAGVPAVVSQGANGGAGDGVAEPILGVSVGNVVDTQRRRRNALTPETRVTSTLLM